MVDQSYNKDQKSHSIRRLQMFSRAMRGSLIKTWAEQMEIVFIWAVNLVGFSMARYMHREMADKHLIYNMANCNGQKSLVYVSREIP